MGKCSAAVNQVQGSPITQLFRGTTGVYKLSHVSPHGREVKLIPFKADDVQRLSYPVVFGIITKHKITF